MSVGSRLDYIFNILFRQQRWKQRSTFYHFEGNPLDWSVNHDDVIKWKHFRVTGPFCEEFTGHRRIPHTKASDAKFDVLFDLCLNTRLCKQSWGWWSGTPWCSLWRHCNVVDSPQWYGNLSMAWHHHGMTNVVDNAEFQLTAVNLNWQ